MTPKLRPAAELAAINAARIPGESEEYRKARTALLAEEIELRRHIERVAAMRRRLPPGAPMTKEYRFEGVDGPVGLADLFGDKDTLVVNSFMYGPQRQRPCPMCTATLGAWDGTARDVEQRISFVMTARSPLSRILDFGRERGWRNLRLFSDPSGQYTRDFVHPDDVDIAAYNVFTRRDGTIRHFWKEEMGPETADPGQDPRGAPDFMPMWLIFDTTPEGRHPTWYPSLEYPTEGKRQ